MFCLTTLVMQFFTVSVFLFWGTSFFEISLGLEKNLAMVSLGVVCLTAPGLGVVLGGMICDDARGVRDLQYCFCFCFKYMFIGYIFINTFSFLDIPFLCVGTLWLGIAIGKSLIQDQP